MHRPTPNALHRTLLVLLLALASAVLHAESRTVERDFAAQPGGRLELDLRTGGSVTVQGWDQARVEVLARVSGRDADDHDIRIEETGDGIRVLSRMRDEGRRRSFHSNAKFEIRVPRRYDLSFETMGGDVTLTGLEGDLRGETMGGDLELSDLRGRLDLSTMGGGIRLLDSDVDGKVGTMGGDVLLRDVVGDVEGSSMGGRVRMENVSRRDGRSTGDAVVMKTMGGKIEVDDAPHGAELETMGGNIEVGRAGAFVNAKTMGGDIEIAAIDGWVEAVTMGGNVRVEMVGDPDAGRRDVLIRSMGGSIELTLPAGIDARFETEIVLTRENGFRSSGEPRYEVRSDFPLATELDAEWREADSGRRRNDRKTLRGEGASGGGTHTIKLQTWNGDIVIRRAG